MNEKSQREIFTENIKKLMDSMGRRQIDIVDKLGYPSSVVSDWVNGKKYPRVDAMQNLADYFGVRVSDLTSESEKDPQPKLDLDEEEQDFITIFRSLTRREKTQLMAKVYEFDERRASRGRIR